MKSKRQTTRAKLERERRLQERRELKREKKQAAAAAQQAEEDAGDAPATEVPADGSSDADL